MVHLVPGAIRARTVDDLKATISVTKKPLITQQSINLAERRTVGVHIDRREVVSVGFVQIRLHRNHVQQLLPRALPYSIQGGRVTRSAVALCLEISGSE